MHVCIAGTFHPPIFTLGKWQITHLYFCVYSNKYVTSTFRFYRNIQKYVAIWKYLSNNICVSLMRLPTFHKWKHTHTHRYYYFIINQSKMKWSFDRLWKMMLIQGKKMEWKEEEKKTKYTIFRVDFVRSWIRQTNVYTWNLLKMYSWYPCMGHNRAHIRTHSSAPNMCYQARCIGCLRLRACVCVYTCAIVAQRTIVEVEVDSICLDFCFIFRTNERTSGQTRKCMRKIKCQCMSCEMETIQMNQYRRAAITIMSICVCAFACV